MKVFVLSVGDPESSDVVEVWADELKANARCVQIGQELQDMNDELDDAMDSDDWTYDDVLYAQWAKRYENHPYRWAKWCKVDAMEVTE